MEHLGYWLLRISQTSYQRTTTIVIKDLAKQEASSLVTKDKLVMLRTIYSTTLVRMETQVWHHSILTSDQTLFLILTRDWPLAQTVLRMVIITKTWAKTISRQIRPSPAVPTTVATNATMAPTLADKVDSTHLARITSTLAMPRLELTAVARRVARMASRGTRGYKAWMMLWCSRAMQRLINNKTMIRISKLIEIISTDLIFSPQI